MSPCPRALLSSLVLGLVLGPSVIVSPQSTKKNIIFCFFCTTLPSLHRYNSTVASLLPVRQGAPVQNMRVPTHEDSEYGCSGEGDPRPNRQEEFSREYAAAGGHAGGSAVIDINGTLMTVGTSSYAQEAARLDPADTRQEGERLYHAVVEEQESIVHALLTDSTDVAAAMAWRHPRDGATPLHGACKAFEFGGRAMQIGALLLNAGAAVDVVDDHGRTPLMTAVAKCSKEEGLCPNSRGFAAFEALVEMLLSNGASLALTDGNGQSAIELDVKCKFTHLWRKYGACG